MKNQNEARGRKTRGRMCVRRRDDHSQSCSSAPSAHVPVFHIAGLSNVEGKKMCVVVVVVGVWMLSLSSPSAVHHLSSSPSLSPLLLSVYLASASPAA